MMFEVPVTEWVTRSCTYLVAAEDMWDAAERAMNGELSDRVTHAETVTGRDLGDGDPVPAQAAGGIEIPPAAVEA